ncbi:MAG TPA: short-chain dehydrogenase [Gammaproteobacteria bacterium]|jgi:NAD(P)-dependent dehydrogenase (short-subunit alcohol dehydrogenase family)|nr:short-chain dehydrogenase [Gammaproteobacteria bacterium]
MQGRTVVITGGNSGIGLVAARELARQGAALVLACRDTDKTAAALESINAVAATPAINVPVDLASLESVRRLAAELLARCPRIDVLINNAGLFPSSQERTADGFEMQFGVNHLSHFLLTALLRDRLVATKDARVVTVSSMLHKRGRMDFESFRGVPKYSANAAYAQSKLANVLFALALARRLEGTGVTSNVLHPGGVATDITRDLPWLVRKLIGFVFISPEMGAKTTLMLATDPALAGVSGVYFDQCKRADVAALANDTALQDRLWQVSADLVGVAC